MIAPREHFHRPRRELAPFVESIHWSESAEGGTYPLEHLPDGRSSLYFRLAGEGRGGLFVAGPRRKAHFKLAHRIPLQVRVVFRVGSALPFLGMPAPSSVGGMLPLAEFWGSAAAEIGEQLMEARAPELVIHALESALLERRRACDAFEPAAARLVRRVASLVTERVGPGAPLRLGLLAAELGVSERHLRRTFTEQVGLAPKQFARIMRLHRALRAEGDWSTRARLAGYYDQAHLIGEFRALLGITPEAHARGQGPAPQPCSAAPG